MNEIEETAKATQEVAKAAAKAIDTADRLGGFFDRIFGRGLDALGGAFFDWAEYFRLKNALKLAEKVDEIHRQRELRGKINVIPLRLGIPLMQAATLEDDDGLQDMWAALIANSTDPNSQVVVGRLLINLLSNLEPLDAIVLKAIYDDEILNPERHPRDKVRFIGEPGMENRNLEWIENSLGYQRPSLRLSLENLDRLGSIQDVIPEEGTEVGVPPTHPAGALGVTDTGRALVEACSPRGRT